MIKKLKIERFKSIKSLDLECRRINLFIGEPNVGKSNILESLGFLSWCATMTQPLSAFVRAKGPNELFYDNLSTEEPLRIAVQGDASASVTVAFDVDHFKVQTGEPEAQIAHLSLSGERFGPRRPVKELGGVKFYRYADLEKFESMQPGALLPPDGRNLFSCVYTSKELRERVTDLFRPYGLALVMKPQEKAFEVQKNVDGIVSGFRYATSSDTLLRIIFFTAAMDSNKGATLVFEEPEAHAFPYYTKQMGEEIAFDTDNQYFIATHNPYLLSAILEKAHPQDVNVCVTSYHDFETRVHPLSEAERSELLKGDPFFMSGRFAGGGAR